MLPIYLYKKIMLEKSGSSSVDPADITKAALLSLYLDPVLNKKLMKKKGEILDKLKDELTQSRNSKLGSEHNKNNLEKEAWWKTLLGIGIPTVAAIGGYQTLNHAEPYFVKKLRESAYGGPDTAGKFKELPNIFASATSQNFESDRKRFLNQLDERFKLLQQGKYAPGLSVNTTYNNNYKDQSFFSPVWNALRYINVFNTKSAPVYEKHYTNPQEYISALKRYRENLLNKFWAGRSLYTLDQQNKIRDMIDDLDRKIMQYEVQTDTLDDF